MSWVAACEAAMEARVRWARPRLRETKLPNTGSPFTPGMGTEPCLSRPFFHATPAPEKAQVKRDTDRKAAAMARSTTPSRRLPEPKKAGKVNTHQLLSLEEARPKPNSIFKNLSQKNEQKYPRCLRGLGSNEGDESDERKEVVDMRYIWRWRGAVKVGRCKNARNSLLASLHGNPNGSMPYCNSCNYNRRLQLIFATNCESMPNRLIFNELLFVYYAIQISTMG